MIIKVGAKTDIGRKRKENEDKFSVDTELGLFAVADGVGGAAFGEIASSMGIEIITDYIRNSKSQKTPMIGKFQHEFSEATNRLNAAVMLSNKAIYEAASSNPLWQGMSTTIASVLLENNRLSLVHAGDSRIYLLRAGLIEQLTDDHTLAYEQVKKGLMSNEEASDLKLTNVITRALGIAPEIETSIDEMTVLDGDILLLCTDGLNTLLTDNEIAETIMTSSGPMEACNSLIDKANAKGGHDNITIIIAYINEKKRFPFLHKLFKMFRLGV
ncbi:MAG: serine/threonine-protein phosphatase [Nitrospirae bacterium]|nr:serine/threonine-protein phosphatase [Nitrospirota bacterium]MBF0541263.1 serine/threonine-protein phosphatase [Nitrospirota bacterium]